MSAKKKKPMASEVGKAVEEFRGAMAKSGVESVTFSTPGREPVVLDTGARERLAAPSLFPGEAPADLPTDDEPEPKEPSDPPPNQKRLKFRAGANTVKLQSAELLRGLGAVHYAASTDEERPHLASVHFHASDELVMTATSGAWLCRWTMEPEELPAVPVAMLVSIFDVKRLLPLLAADAKGVNQVVLNFDDGVANFTDGTVLPLAKRDIGTTVQFDSVIPTTPVTGCPAIAWMPSLMARVMRSFKAGYGDGVAVDAKFRSALAPIVLVPFGHDEMFVLMMPARTETEEAKPVDAPPPAEEPEPAAVVVELDEAAS